jgi:predicted ArsR family transcriptional regulator
MTQDDTFRRLARSPFSAVYADFNKVISSHASVDEYYEQLADVLKTHGWGADEYMAECINYRLPMGWSV